MSEKVIFTNSQGLSVELGNKGPFILTKIEGTGAVTADIQTQKSPFQDGTTYIDNTLEPRPLSIEIMLVAENEEEMTRMRRRLLQVFNPKLGPGKLIYEFGDNRKEIEAISELAPAFPNARPFEDTMQPGLISLYCPNPFWKGIRESKEIAQWLGGLTFPLKLPTRFATKGEPRALLINEGDVETPLDIIIIGPATNPMIRNRTTGEFIKVKRTLEPGDRLYISTEFGNKKVVIKDNEFVETNVFHWIDLDSTFINLRVGDNAIEYTSDDDVFKARVLIKYRNRYVGI